MFNMLLEFEPGFDLHILYSMHILATGVAPQGILSCCAIHLIAKASPPAKSTHSKRRILKRERYNIGCDCLDCI